MRSNGNDSSGAAVATNDKDDNSFALTSGAGVEIVASPTAFEAEETGDVNQHDGVSSNNDADQFINYDAQDEDEEVFFGMAWSPAFKKVVLGLGSAAMLIVTFFAVFGIVGASRNRRTISSSASVVATGAKAPKAPKAPKAGGYYDFLYSNGLFLACRDFENLEFPAIIYSSTSAEAEEDPHAYCTSKCNRCVFEEGMIPEEMFRGVGHGSSPFSVLCACYYDALVHDDTTIDFTCAYEDEDFLLHRTPGVDELGANGSGPMRRSKPPFVPDGDNYSCYQWVEFGSTFAPTVTPTTPNPSCTFGICL